MFTWFLLSYLIATVTAIFIFVKKVRRFVVTEVVKLSAEFDTSPI